MTINLSVFKELTNDEQLDAFIEKSKTYTDLYVDMNDAEARKFVKDSADEINQILKKVDRTRIDKAKSAKVDIDAQAKYITEKLTLANKPWVDLIDAYKVERKKVLDAEKAEAEAKAAAAQYVIDHEFGLLMNDKFDADKAAQAAEQEKHDNEIKAAAIENEKQATIDAEENAKIALEQAEIKRVQDVENARLAEIARQENEALRIESERKKREDNTAHLANVNNEILYCMVGYGVDKDAAIKVIKLMAAKKLPYVQVNY